MKKNQGFSYIELLVTVAIIGIAISLVSLSISTIFSLNAKKCAKDIASLLSECKVDAMSRAGDTYLILYKESEGVTAEYYISDNLVSEEIIGKSNLSLTYTDSNGLARSATAADKICISFERSTGAFMDIADSHYLYDEVVTGDGVYYDEITVSSGKIYHIDLIPSTGRFSVDIS